MYGLKFLMNVGSPEPVMTRHLWPAAILTGLSVAAGVDALRAAANATQPVATATAIQRDDGILRRIGCSFLAQGWAVDRLFPKTFPESLTGLLQESQALSRKLLVKWGYCVPERSGTCFNERMAQAASSRPTIREIADQAGVSIATVSRVLNGRGDVADDTRDNVSRVIREKGYTPNRSARGLSMRGGRVSDIQGRRSKRGVHPRCTRRAMYWNSLAKISAKA